MSEGKLVRVDVSVILDRIKQKKRAERAEARCATLETALRNIVACEPHVGAYGEAKRIAAEALSNDVIASANAEVAEYWVGDRLYPWGPESPQQQDSE